MPRPSLFIGRQRVGVGSKQVMDLLGSILNSMDKPPTPSEQERLAAKGVSLRLISVLVYVWINDYIV